MYQLALPDGSHLEVDDALPIEKARDIAVKNFPDLFPDKTYGVGESFLSAAKQQVQGLAPTYRAAGAAVGLGTLSPEDISGPPGDIPTAGPFALLQKPRQVIGETLGQGIAGALTSSPAILAGRYGGMAAGSLFGPAGAEVGATVGGFAAAYPMNLGNTYQQMLQEKIPEGAAKAWSIAVALPISALDSITLGVMSDALSKYGTKPIIRALGKALGGGTVKEAEAAGAGILSDKLAAIVAEHPLVSGVMAETFTEGAQQAMQNAATASAGGNPFFTRESMENITQNALAGGVGGLMLGGGMHLAGIEGRPKAPQARDLLTKEDLLTSSDIDSLQRQKLYAGLEQAGLKQPENAPLALPNFGEPVPRIAPDTGAEVANPVIEQAKTTVKNESPIGTFNATELGATTQKQVDSVRKARGLPQLTDYSIEDVAQAGVPREETDRLIGIRTDFNPKIKVTTDQIIKAAMAKNIVTGGGQNEGFQNFLRQTTGWPDISTLSQTQRQAALSALNGMDKMPVLASLPIVTAATNFTEAHYGKAQQAIADTGSTSLKTVMDATGLKNKNDANTLRMEMVRRGDLVRDTDIGGRPVFLTKEEAATKAPAEAVKPPVEVTPKEVVPGYQVQPTTTQNAQGEAVPGHSLYALPEGEGKPALVGTFPTEDQAHAAAVARASDTDLETMRQAAQDTRTPEQQSLGTPGPTIAQQKVGVLAENEAARRAGVVAPAGGVASVIMEPGGTPEDIKARIRGPVQVAPDVVPKRNIPQEKLDKLSRVFHQTLTNMGLKGVDLSLVAGQKGEGVYHPYKHLIAISLDALHGPLRALHHEAVHALREMGLISERNWKLLTRKIDAEGWLDKPIGKFKQSINERYKGENLSKDALYEEAAADMFAAHAMNDLHVSGFFPGIAHKIRNFFEALKNGLRGLGFNSADDVFERMQRGEAGTAEAKAGTEMKQSLADQYNADVGTVETVPTTKTEVGEALSSLPEKAKESFTRRSIQIIQPKPGNDIIASAIGIPAPSISTSTGGYENTINPNAVVRFGGMVPNFQVDQYTRAWQYVFKQDGVAWFKPNTPAVFNVADPRYILGFSAEFKQALSPEQERRFFDVLRNKVNPDIGYTKVGANEFAIANFRSEGVPFMMPDAAFRDGIDQALTEVMHELGLKNSKEFGAESQYHYHDWEGDPSGTALIAEARAAGGQDFESRLRDARGQAAALETETINKAEPKQPAATTGEAARYSLTDAAHFAEVLPHLDEEDQSLLGKAAAQNVVNIFRDVGEKVPSGEIGAIAYAGKAQRGWYTEAARTLQTVFGPDTERFTSLLASLSPRVPVRQNLEMATGIWNAWLEAGRPNDYGSVQKVMKAVPQSTFRAYKANVERVLTSPEAGGYIISGPKVGEFYGALLGETQRVVLDTHMADFMGVASKLFDGVETKTLRDDFGTFRKKSATYVALSALFRKAATDLSELTGDTWTPAEVQSGVWSWTKAMKDVFAHNPDTPVAELLQDRDTFNTLLDTTPTFGALLNEDTYRSTLENAGYKEAYRQIAESARTNAETQQGEAARTTQQGVPLDVDTQREIEAGAAERLRRHMTKEQFSLPDQPSQITMVRHGTTALNEEDRVRGWADVPLDAKGWSNARAVAEQLKNSKPDVIVASDLARARDTANEIGKTTGTPVTLDPSLRPWDVGDYTGKPSDAANKVFEKHLKTPDVPVDGGESFNQFKDRFLNRVKEINADHPGKHVMLVAHHRNERVLNAWIKNGMPDDNSIDEKAFANWKAGINPGEATTYGMPKYSLSGNTEQQKYVQPTSQEFLNEVNRNPAERDWFDRVRRADEFWSRITPEQQSEMDATRKRYSISDEYIQGLTQDEKFKRFYDEKSNLRDRNNLPLVLYHGTNYPAYEESRNQLFDRFKPHREYRPMTFLSTDPKFANAYAGVAPGYDIAPENTGAVIPAFVRGRMLDTANKDDMRHLISLVRNAAYKRADDAYMETLKQRQAKNVIPEQEDREIADKRYNEYELTLRNFLESMSDNPETDNMLNMFKSHATPGMIRSVENFIINNFGDATHNWPAMEARHTYEPVRAAGYDGMVITEDAATNVAVFEPKNIKSVFNDEFDPKNEKFSLTGEATHQVQSEGMAERLGKRFPEIAARYKDFVTPMGKLDDLRIKFQDKNLPLKRLEEWIQRRGGSVPDAFSSYLKADAFNNIVGDRIDRAERTLYTPLLDELKRSKVPLHEADAWLAARHAPERNAYLKNKFGVEDGSGPSYTDAKAPVLKAELEAKHGAAQMEKIGALFDNIIKNTNDVRQQGQLTDTYDPSIGFKHYAPLRKSEEDVDETPIPKWRKTGMMGDVRGREDPAMLGRKTDPEHVIASAIMQNEQSIKRAEGAGVGRAFAAMVRANPNNGYVKEEKFKPTPQTWTVDEDGAIRVRQHPAYSDAQTLIVKEADPQNPGKIKETAFHITDMRVANAIKGVNGSSSELASTIVRALGPLNHFLANINTGMNPEFLVSNLIKDLQMAEIVLQGTDYKGTAGRIVKNIPNAVKGIWKVLKNDPAAATDEWSKLFDDMSKHGGRTAFLGITDIGRKVKDIQKHVSAMETDKRPSVIMGAMKSVYNLVEDMNTTFENATRLSTYKAALDGGATPEQAGTLARNITINFSRGGEYKTLVNSMYLFYNASLQGSMVLINAMKSPRVRKIAAGIVIGGMLIDALNRALSPDDKDGQNAYDKIMQGKPWVGEHMMVLMIPGSTKYISLPMPYGFNAFYNLGRNLSSAAAGKTPIGQAAKSILFTGVDAFNPLSGTESFLNFAAPTILDPFVDLATNQNFAGQKIVPDQDPFSPYKKPDSQLYWSNTATPYVKVAEWVNKLTGGTTAIKGGVDVSPQTLEYWVDYGLGATGAFAQRTARMSYAALTGDFDNIEVGQIPFLRKAVGGLDKRASTEAYYNNATQVLTAKAELQQAVVTHDPARMKAALQEHGKELQLAGVFARTDQQLAALRGAKRKMLADEAIPQEFKRSQKDRFDAQQDFLITNANRLYNTAMSQGAK